MDFIWRPLLNYDQVARIPPGRRVLMSVEPERAMRSFLFLSALIVVALAIDASKFNGRYRRAVLWEANSQTQQFAYKVTRYFEPPIN